MASWFMQAAAAPRDHDHVFFITMHTNLRLSRDLDFKKIRVERRFSFPMVDVFTMTKKTVLQFYSVKWNIFDFREIIDNFL